MIPELVFTISGIPSRNVMLYFDKPTIDRLVHRLSEMLEPGGHLFAGHAEQIGVLSKKLLCVQPAVYVKAT